MSDETWQEIIDRLESQNQALQEALKESAAEPCEASDFYDIAEDGVSRCLDPEYNEMVDDTTLSLCTPCRARNALSPTQETDPG